MNWDAECLLISTVTERDERGVSSKRDVPRRVFCNAFSIGNDAFFTAQAAGVHPVAMLQLRTCDYNGEKTVKFNGDTLAVVRSSVKPDFTVLTLEERTGDRDDHACYRA